MSATAPISHVCKPICVFRHAHVIPENEFFFFSPQSGEILRSFLTVCLPHPPVEGAAIFIQIIL